MVWLMMHGWMRCPTCPTTSSPWTKYWERRLKASYYEYDLGDGWQYQVDVQMVMIADEDRNSWPMCLAGANACPPEDVGGLGGYEEFLEAVRDPSHEEHDAMRRWCGGPFDPMGFDVNSANRDIRRWLIEAE
jgi:hypothetical protein